MLLTIVLIIIAIIIISKIIDYLKSAIPKILPVIGIIALIVLCISMPPLGIAVIIIIFVANSAKKSNDNKIKIYLEQECMNLGYITPNDFLLKLSEYKNKLYSKKFEEIISDFERTVNKNVSEKLKKELLDVIEDNQMLDYSQLCEENYPCFIITHFISDSLMIKNVANDLVQTKKIEYIESADAYKIFGLLENSEEISMADLLS